MVNLTFLQVDQLVFEELVRERFPKLGLYLLAIITFQSSFLLYYILIYITLLQLIIWIIWEFKWHG